MLFVELNKQLDKSAWHTQDPQWLKARKKHWQTLVKFFKAHKILRPDSIKYYQTYFLTGELQNTQEIGYFPREVNAFLIMMFYPDQTKESLKAVFNKYCETYHPQKVMPCCDDSIDFFEKNIMLFVEDQEGVLGGNESIYCDILYGETKEEQLKRRSYRNQYNFPALCSSLSKFVLDGCHYNYDYFQYIIDFCFLTIAPDELEFGRTKIELPKQLAIFANYEQLDPFKDSNSERYESAWKVVNNLRAKFDNEDLPEELKTLWAEAQNQEVSLG